MFELLQLRVVKLRWRILLHYVLAHAVEMPNMVFLRRFLGRLLLVGLRLRQLVMFVLNDFLSRDMLLNIDFVGHDGLVGLRRHEYKSKLHSPLLSNLLAFNNRGEVRLSMVHHENGRVLLQKLESLLHSHICVHHSVGQILCI